MSPAIAALLLCSLSVAYGFVYQIKLSQGLDPTSMVVTWSTNNTVSGNSQVIYGTTATSLNLMAEGGDGRSYSFQSFDNNKAHTKTVGAYLPLYTSPLIHTVRLNNLAPGTKYYYKCGDTVSSDLSAMISFTTLPAVGSVIDAKGQPFTFAVMADTSFNGVVNGSTYLGFMNFTVANIMNSPSIGMVLLPGDMSYADCNAPGWDMWDNQNAPMTQQTPFMVSAGNHEQEQEPVTGKTYTAFEARYAMPRHSPAQFSAITVNSAAFGILSPARTQAKYKCGGSVFNSGYDYGNSFYSFNAGLAHIIFMNAYTNYEAGSNQYVWLVNDLMAVDRTKTPWIIVNFHTPWYNTYQGKHNEMEAFGMKKSMEDLFYQYRVNAAFSGHVHAYERFLPMYNNVTNTNATIYMTVGTGGQNYDGNKFVGVSPASKNETYSSVYTHTGIIYGYGTLTINSASVATWNMFKNSMTVSPGQTAIDTVLICNSYTTGSAICPYTTIPSAGPTSVFIFAQIISGVTLTQGLSSTFQTAFIASMAAALGVPVSAVTIKSVTVASGRRLGESDARQLSASSAVKVSFLVTSSATASSVTTSIKNSAASLTNNLNAVGGFSATVGSASIDTSTPSPTAAPVYNAYVVATPNSCFSGSETVALESGEVKFISDVTVGDRVLAASAAGKTLYSDVVFVPHGANKESAVFMHITTESGRDVKMTQSHIIPAGVCGSSLPLVYASKVTVGDCVLTVSGEEKVSSVESVRGEGVYTIVTKEEFIVVNGIVASPFGANHMMANMYYNIHRFAFTIAPTLLATNLFHSINEGLGLFAIFFGSV